MVAIGNGRGVGSPSHLALADTLVTLLDLPPLQVHTRCAPLLIKVEYATSTKLEYIFFNNPKNPEWFLQEILHPSNALPGTWSRVRGCWQPPQHAEGGAARFPRIPLPLAAARRTMDVERSRGGRGEGGQCCSTRSITHTGLKCGVLGPGIVLLNPRQRLSEAQRSTLDPSPMEFFCTPRGHWTCLFTKVVSYDYISSCVPALNHAMAIMLLTRIPSWAHNQKQCPHRQE